MRFRVKFEQPRRIFFVEAENEKVAGELAKCVEMILEKRERTLDDAVVQALTEGLDDDYRW